MKLIIQIRTILFIIGCIGSRLALTALSAFSPKWILSILGYFALMPVIGWFYIIFIGKRDTGLEVFGDKIWWKMLRPIHLFLWGLFAYFAISGNTHSWVILLIDTLIGLVSFILFHWMNGDFI